MHCHVHLLYAYVYACMYTYMNTYLCYVTSMTMCTYANMHVHIYDVRVHIYEYMHTPVWVCPYEYVYCMHSDCHMITCLSPATARFLLPHPRHGSHIPGREGLPRALPLPERAMPQGGLAIRRWASVPRPPSPRCPVPPALCTPPSVPVFHPPKPFPCTSESSLFILNLYCFTGV